MSGDPRIPRLGLGLLTRSIPPRLVEQVLAETGCRQRRIRRLPAALTVYFVLACCLFPGNGYAGVIRHLAAGLGWLATCWTPPVTSALTEARRRLTAAPLLALFARVRGPLARPDTAGTWWFGLRLLAVDGTTVEVADTAANDAQFGRPKGGGYPQARMVAVLECGTRAMVTAAWDSYDTSEQELFDRLLPTLPGAGTLLLADKNFLSHRRWQTAAATGAHLLWRVRGGHVFALPLIRKLPDGSYLSRLFDPADARRHRKAATRGQPRHGHPDGITVRVIPYTVTTIRADRQPTTTFYRLVTTLLDHRHAPADALAACYRQRWQDETGLADLKTRQLPPGTVLRSHTPDGVNQELAAHLTIYQALRQLAHHSAEHAGVPCQRISFTAVRQAATRQVTTNAAPTNTALHTAWQQACQEITSQLLPEHRPERSYRRHVKRPRSRYPTNHPDHQHPTTGPVTHHIHIGTQTHQPTPTPDP